MAMALRLPPPRWLAIGLGAAVPLALLVALAWLPRKQGGAIFLVAFLAGFAAFAALRPSNNRNWMPDVARTPTAMIQDGRLLVHDVRTCVYRSEFDYDARFEDRTYDLDQVQGMDLFLVSWGPRHIAHVIISFDFGKEGHLAFSIETRKQWGQSYSAIRGFFREYELYIVVADERDVICLRTNYRKEVVRLYHLDVPPDGARQVLMDYLARINGLAAHPEWYDALTDNCTTAMIGPIRTHTNRLPWSWKLIASGHLDELLYSSGFISHDLPFDQLRKRAVINDRAMVANQDPAFSTRIRAGTGAFIGPY
ncbi:MAG: DUF4105 domain-containing protein [Holophaga sp.]|nr:DUF4105 domain-containing protein [Holophaga sp.]